MLLGASRQGVGIMGLAQGESITKMSLTGLGGMLLSHGDRVFADTHPGA